MRAILISNMTDLKYELRRSKRKTVSVEISREARIIVRAPLKMPLRYIDAFLQSKSSWITEHLERVKSTVAQMPPKLSEQELSELRERAKKEIPARVSLYASLMGVEYGKITVRTQKTRFGSCSSKGNLNINLAVMLMPQDIADYVIVHELAHLKEMNHSQRFWKEVERRIPDYKQKRAFLKEKGISYINRI